MFAWDPDFTKLTQAERDELEHIQKNDEYISMSLNALQNEIK